MSTAIPRLLAMVAVLGLLPGCDLLSSSRKSFTCPKGSYPCGNGCMPANAVCCDDGTGQTSSYCTNQATGCFKNDRECQAVFPAGVQGSFCCGTSGTTGSNDCPEGQRHCGLLCRSVEEPCCPEGASSEQCPIMSWDPGGCSSAKPGYVGCGVCLDTKSCVACPPGQCCSGVFCGGGPGAVCIAGDACTGDPKASSKGSSGCSSDRCSSDGDCEGFAQRHCGGSGNARCGGDGQCHCCLQQCDINPSTGVKSNCRCMGCASCGGDTQCLRTMCVFNVGGGACQ